VVASLLAVVGPAGARADIWTGGIEGKVTVWGWGAEISDVLIVATTDTFTGVTESDSHGNYQLFLPPGEYQVEFFWHSQGTTLYYPGTHDRDKATPLTVTDQVVSGIDAEVQTRGSMIGRVTDDRTGLPVVGMCADVHDGQENLAGTAVSEAGGWLHYPDIALDHTDRWDAAFVKLYDCNDIGYYVTEWYRDLPGYLGVSTNVIEPGRYGRFDAQVGYMANVAGTVTDEDGNPLQGICVTLRHSEFVDWYPALFLRDDTTDRNGYFSMGQVTPSPKHVLDLEDCNDPVSYSPQYGVPAPTVSEMLSFDDQLLEDAAWITGVVTDASTGVPLEGVCVSATEDPSGNDFDSDYADASGAYTLLVPSTTDHQYVKARRCVVAPDSDEVQWWEAAPTFEEATDLAVGAGETRSGIDLTLPMMATLQGTLTGTDGLPAEATITLEPQFEAAGSPPHGQSGSDGSYHIDNVEPGTYLIEFGDPATYVPEWYDDASTAEAATPVAFEWGEVVTIDAQLELAGTVPAVPGTPVATASNGAIDVVWTAPGDDGGTSITNYELRVNDVTLTADTYIDAGTALSASIDGLDNGHIYRIQARAENSFGSGAWSDWSAEVTPSAPAGVPDAPTDAIVTVTGIATASGSWTVPADGGGAAITGYELRLENVSTATAETFSVGVTTTFDFAGLTPGDTYRYRVRARNTAGWSDWAVWSPQFAVGTMPDAPQSLTAYGDDRMVRVWWSEPDDHGSPLDSYEVEFQEIGRPESTVTVTIGDPLLVRAHVFDGLPNLHHYRTRVRAHNGWGWSPWAEWSEPAMTRSDSGFVDSGDSVFFGDIWWLATEGVTMGCNPPESDLFCPDDPVTRGQMAAFLVRALVLTDRLDDPFTDDDSSVFEADIERLAAAGITMGCNPPVNNMFCPDAPVTRGQMAAFLVRALGYTDAGDGDLFTDDDGSVFEADIDRLATAGVTRGCNPPTNDMFCPTQVVTRGQMAAFLHRAVG